MQEIGAFAAKNTLGTLLDKVERGEQIAITRHGKPVARLVPNAERPDRERIAGAMHRIRARAAKTRLGIFNWKEIRRERDAGRP
jgi:prevent-host-death family protein